MTLGSQGFTCSGKLPFSAVSLPFASDKLQKVCIQNEKEVMKAVLVSACLTAARRPRCNLLRVRAFGTLKGRAGLLRACCCPQLTFTASLLPGGNCSRVWG